MFEGLSSWFKRLVGSSPTNQEKMDTEDKQAGREAPQPNDTVQPVKIYLSAEALIKKFKVRESGRDDGARNYPGPDADTFGDFEVKIAGQCNDALILVRTETLKQLSGLEAKIQSYDIASVETHLNMERDRAIREMRALVTNEKESLTALKTKEYVALRSLKHFKKSHGRIDMPNESLHFLVVLAGFSAAVFIEAGLNSIFFAEAVEGGEAEGSLVAAIVSGVNILFSMGAGLLFLKYINHVHTGKKMLGWLSVFAFVGFLLVFHYGIAAMRNAMVTIGIQELDQSKLAELTIQNLQSFSSIFTNINSALLFFLGIGLGGWAAYWGAAKIKDPYPGYSKVGDKFSKATGHFNTAWKGLRDKIADRVKELETAYKQSIKEQEARLSVFFRMTRDYETAIAFHDENRKQIETVCARVLMAYWEENREVRTARAPEHFGKEANLLVEFPHETLDAEPLREESASIVDEDKIRAEANLVKVHQEAEKLVANLDELLHELENIANARSVELVADVIAGSNVQQLHSYATSQKARKSA